MAQESTRYCNYSKSKFNSELIFIQPCWCDDEILQRFINDPGITAEFSYDYTESEKEISAIAVFYEACEQAENYYFSLLERGWKPQEARAILPLCTKSEAVMTGFVSDWNHLFRLRTSIIAETGQPHPQCAEIIDPLYKEFIKRGYEQDS